MGHFGIEMEISDPIVRAKVSQISLVGIIRAVGKREKSSHLVRELGSQGEGPGRRSLDVAETDFPAESRG